MKIVNENYNHIDLLRRIATERGEVLRPCDDCPGWWWVEEDIVLEVERLVGEEERSAREAEDRRRQEALLARVAGQVASETGRTADDPGVLEDARHRLDARERWQRLISWVQPRVHGTELDARVQADASLAEFERKYGPVDPVMRSRLASWLARQDFRARLETKLADMASEGEWRVAASALAADPEAVRGVASEDVSHDVDRAVCRRVQRLHREREEEARRQASARRIWGVLDGDLSPEDLVDAELYELAMNLSRDVDDLNDAERCCADRGKQLRNVRYLLRKWRRDA